MLLKYFRGKKLEKKLVILTQITAISCPKNDQIIDFKKKIANCLCRKSVKIGKNRLK
jgi:hypothetical protein